MPVVRCANNPVIEPADIKPSSDGFEVVGVFNPGVARLKDETILLLRVAERPVSSNPDIVLAAVYDIAKGAIVFKEFSKNDPQNDFSDPRLIIQPTKTFLTSISHLRLARSSDGVNFKIDDVPTIVPENDYEAFGLEDPRIALIDGVHYITYVAVSALGVTTCLISTEDFKSFRRHGAIFCPDNKDVAIFAGKVGNNFYALHRPSSSLFKNNQIWLAESCDLMCWGNHRVFLETRQGMWDETRIGASAVPFQIDRGWLEIYHGADRNNRYCLGAALLDSRQPWKVLARSRDPILQPQADYEIKGFFGNVVFSCGLLYEEEKLKIYYGVADTAVCFAELPLQDVLDNLNL